MSSQLHYFNTCPYGKILTTKRVQYAESPYKIAMELLLYPDMMCFYVLLL